jgi:uncharacterized protein YajQ (UPF0234 family)
MEPVTLLVIGATSALSSAVSAIIAWVRRSRSSKISVKIGSQTLRVSSANRDEIEAAIQSLQKTLDSGASDQNRGAEQTATK